jgi:hypothetical protein
MINAEPTLPAVAVGAFAEFRCGVAFDADGGFEVF